MNVLVTGGHGFIGRYLLSKLCQRGHNVTVLDMQPKPAAVIGISYDHYEGDLLDSQWLETVWPSNADAIVHLVGLADAGEAQKEPDKSFELNVVSLEKVLEVCRTKGKSRVLVPSTAAVYGVTHNLPVAEDVEPSPTNVYAWHKLMAEQLLKAYSQAYGIQCVAFRLFNVYGRGHKGVIDLALRKAHLGEPLEIKGADQLRDFVYAGDVVEAMVKVVEQSTLEHTVLNIGSGQGISIRKVVSLIAQLYPSLDVVYRDDVDTVCYDSEADIVRASTLLNWAPNAGAEFMKTIVKQEMMYEHAPQ